MPPQPVTTPRSPPGTKVVRSVEIALALMFIGAVLLNCANVFGRYVLAHSFIGAEEVQTYVMVLMTFLGAALVALRGKELRMDVLLLKMPPPARRGVRLLESVVMVVCCGFTAWQSALYAWQLYQLDVHSDGVEIPMWLPHGAVTLGLALVALIALARAVGRLRGGRTDDDLERQLH